MKTRLALFAALLLAATSHQVLAAPATPDGAKALAASLQSYFTAEPGVVTVTPSGEAYDFKLDFAPLLNKAPQPGFQARISPIEMKLAEQGGGKWQVTQDQSLEFTFKAEGTADMAGKIGSLKGTGIFDEALGAFSSSSTDIGDFGYQQTVTAPNQPPSHVEYHIDSLHFETAMTPAAEGAADGTVRMTMGTMVEKFDVPGGPGGTPPMNFVVTVAKGSQDGTITGLKAKPAAALLSFLVGHPTPEAVTRDQAQLKDLLRAVLPIFARVESGAVLEDMKVATPMGEFAAGRMTVEVGMNGVVETGALREKIGIEAFVAPPGLVPPWGADLVPTSFSFDFGASDFNLAAPAKLILDALDLSKNPPVPKELDPQLTKALLPKGAVTTTLGPSTIVAKIADITAEGSMLAGPEVPPSGSALIAVKGLDAIMTTLQAAPPEMGMAQLLPMFMLAKGMAKPGDGGALTWKIETTPQGSVFVNGTDLSKMGGSGQ